MSKHTAFNFPLTIKYTQRRGSIAFQVFAEGVKVLAPKGVRQKDLNQMLAEKSEWMEQAWEAARENAKPARLYQTGEPFPYLGEHYPISIIKTDREHVELDTGELCVDLLVSNVQDIQIQCETVIATWLQEQAESYLPHRLEKWIEVTTWQPSSLKIRDYKSRWGSCDRLGRLTLNNRLMMAPPEVIDYVLIHELAHLKELNHSARFWALVEIHCPLYKQHQHWLKKHSSAMQLTAEI